MNPSLDREGRVEIDSERILVDLVGTDEMGAMGYVLELELGTALHVQPEDGLILVYHGTQPIGWLDTSEDARVREALQESPVLQCMLYSTEGLRHGTYAVVEFRI